MAEEKKRSPCRRIARANNVNLSMYEDDPLELWVRYISQVIFDITGSGDTDIDALIGDLEYLTRAQIETLKSIEKCMVKARQAKFKRDKGKYLSKERALKKIGKSLGERYDWKLPFDVVSREGWEKTKSSRRGLSEDQKMYHTVGKKFYKRAKREILIPFLMENSDVFKAYVEQAILKNAKGKEEGKQVISYGLKPDSMFPGIADIILDYADEPEDEDTKIVNLMRFGKKSRSKSRRKNSDRNVRKVKKSRSKSRRKKSGRSNRRGRKVRKSR